MLKGYRHTEETRARMSRSAMGHSVSETTRAKISGSKKGRPIPAHIRAKMSIAAKASSAMKEDASRRRGVPLSPEILAARKGRFTGERNGGWLGDSVGYHGAHSRVRTILSGKPCGCCGILRKIHAALKHDATDLRVDRIGKYSISPDDYFPLCAGCHRIYDTADTASWQQHVASHKVIA